MNPGRFALLVITPLILGVAAPAAPAQAQAQASSTAFERAMLAELDDATRAEVEKRATEGNSVIGVVSTILLNNYQKTGPRNPGEALEVVAVDFSRGVAVIRRAPNVFDVQRFDPRTLRLLR